MGGSVTITNSTISGNVTTGEGGGLVSYQATITNSTITGNSADENGGGVASQSTLTIRNSIVAGNVDADGSHPDIRQTQNGPPIVRYSLIGDNNGSGLADSPAAVAPDFNLIGTHAARIDPLLGPLEFNGGPTQTRRPLFGSPVIDGGNNSLAVDPAAQALLTTDQRGAPFVRIFGGTVDLGAFETQPVSLVVDTDVDEADGDEGPGDLSLREAINRTNANVGADTVTFAGWPGRRP